MKFSLLFTLLVFALVGCQSTRAKQGNSATKKTEQMAKKSNNAAADNSALNKKSLYEELTGQKAISASEAPRRILELARDSKWKHDYTTALKRYNTLIVKYPKAAEVKDAYYDKAELYRQMGLIPQAQYNLNMAKKFQQASNHGAKVTH